jgi:hypothetical protein
LFTANAAGTPSSFVPISPVRVLDTRLNAGLTGALVSDTPRLLDVTGSIPVVNPGNVIGVGSPVPDGATSIVANVTGVGPTTVGFVSVRPGTATGKPTTSSLNFDTPGQIVPNSVTVELPTTGANAGQVQLWFKGTGATASTDLLIDIVGYYVPGGTGSPGPAGPAGPKGDTGAKGNTGATGPRGFSAWDVIPSGQTVIGTFKYDSHQPGADTPFLVDDHQIEFGGIAPGTLLNGDINIATPGYGDSAAGAVCTGSSGAPTAPAGKVCVYVAGNAKIDKLATSAGATNPNLGTGFLVNVTTDGFTDADTLLRGSWAYTAP